MNLDRTKWNRKYRQYAPITTPSIIVEEFAALSQKGRALDIATGTGRNAMYLSEQGFTVDAIDISDVGLNYLAGKQPAIFPICADLDTYDISPNRYDLILNIRFCQRRLFPLIIEGLAPGGTLIFESYLEDGTKDGDSPTCRDYLLRKNELLHAFLPLHIIYYAEKTATHRKSQSKVASLVGLKTINFPR